jgi:ABC-type phosphate transport system ATPase subunit
MMSDQLHALYEEVIHLDEIAGELDPESNARIDARRKEIVAQIREIEKSQ